jgi:hypothetical protein
MAFTFTYFLLFPPPPRVFCGGLTAFIFTGRWRFMLAFVLPFFLIFFLLATVRYGINGVYFYGPLATGNCDRSNLKLSKVPAEVYTTYQYVLPLHLRLNKALA